MKKYLLIVFSFIFMNSTFALSLIPKSDGLGTSDRDLLFKALGKRFQDGTLQLSDIPFYLAYLTELAVQLAALLAVIFFMLGGYRYLAGSFEGDTSQGKTMMKYSIIGLIFSISAWFIVDFVVRLLTEAA